MMRVNIVWGKGESINGYINLEPREISEFESLSSRFDGGELDEMVVFDCVDYIHHSKVRDTVLHWISLLRRGGKITIGGNDILEVAKHLTYYRNNLNDANAALFGDGKRSGSTVTAIVSLLEEGGCKVMKNRLNKQEYVIEAIRQ